MTDPSTGDRDTTPAGAPGTRRGLTPVEIQQKEFRPAFRGYNEREVDEFLDQVTEEVARLHADNKRLREEVEAKGTARLDTGSLDEADEILRRAREQAARIVAEGEADAARIRQGDAGTGSAYGGPMAAVPPEDFLSRERRFLQNLANLIQDHASAIKDELRRSREEGGQPSGEADGQEDEAAGADQGAGDGDEGHGETQPLDAGPPTQAWSPPFTTPAPQDDSASERGGDGGALDVGPGPAASAADGAPDPIAEHDPGTPAAHSATQEHRPIATVAAPGGEATASSPSAEKVEAAFDPVRRDRVVPPSVREMPGPLARSTDGDRSKPGGPEAREQTLRELFWGED